MATFGPYDPGAAADDASAGDVIWGDEINVEGSDTAYATASLHSGATTSHYLACTDFGASLTPGGGVVSLITVEVEGAATVGGAIKDIEVKLIVGGVITGTSQHTGAYLGTTDAYRTYSGTPSTWGVSTLTEAQVESANFGVALRYQYDGGGGPEVVRIDHVRITIEYGILVDPFPPNRDSWLTRRQDHVVHVRQRMQAVYSWVPWIPPAGDPAEMADSLTQSAATANARLAHDRRIDVVGY